MTKVKDKTKEDKSQQEETSPELVNGQVEAEEVVTEEASSDGEAEEPTVEEDLVSADLQLALTDAKKEAEENWNKALRIQADFDNFRRRMDRELEGARKFAIEKLVVELLNVKDSVDMGLQAAKDGEADIEKLCEGLALTLKQFETVFEKFNIKEINPLGEEFNPEFHEAMTMAPSEEVAENHVLSVFQKGYVLNERLIRSAKVVVAKGKD